MIKILIAEDDSILAFYFKSLLIDIGYKAAAITIVDTGKKAINLSKKLEPDIIFMDITMKSDKDGIDACLAIKKINSTVKIVFVSAYPKNFFIDEFNNVSYEDYLEKPFNKESIKRCLINLGYK